MFIFVHIIIMSPYINKKLIDWLTFNPQVGEIDVESVYTKSPRWEIAGEQNDLPNYLYTHNLT